MNSRLILLALGLAALGLLPSHGIVLELRDRQTVSEPNIYLDDLLASSQGLSADDLGTIIAIAPSLGKSSTWSRAQIEQVLPAALKERTIEWAGAAACVVERPAVPYGEAEVRQIILAELTRRLPAESTFELLEIPGLQPFLVPDGEPDIEVDLSAGTLRHEWGQAALQFRSQGQVVVVKNVRFHWSCTRKVWRAASPITGGDALSSAAFEQVETDVLKLPGMLQPAADFPEGKVAARALPAGRILMENDWVEPVLVARNDLVTILYEHHGISITVAARALSNGIRDQVIQVQNLSSRKIFNARVVNERSLVYDE